MKRSLALALAGLIAFGAGLYLLAGLPWVLIVLGLVVTATGLFLEV